MKKRFFLGTLSVLLGAFLVVPAFAQEKVVKEVERTVKRDKADINAARQLIKTTLENPETANSAHAWYVAGFVEEKAVENGFIKLQLGEAVDEAGFYKPVYDMVNYYEKAYELDHHPNDKGRVRPKFEKKIREAVSTYYTQLINAGNEGLQSGDFKKANMYFSKFGEMKHHPMFEGTPVATADSLSMEVAFFSAYAATQMEDNTAAAIEELKRIKDVPFNQNEVYQLLALQYINSGDTVSYENTLKEAIDVVPQEPIFLTNLANILIIKGENDQALTFLNQLLEKDPTNPLVFSTMGQIYTEGKKDYKTGESYYLKAVELNPDSKEAIYGLAQVYFNQGADAINEANNITDQDKYTVALEKAKSFYTKALPYLEKVHNLDPENSQFRTALYNVYYNLGMEDKMAEMDAAQ
ncbi:tetratricopeptide repeat protein [Porphyromonas somerae]|uniref:tetratricopeptide repeat protein n=1 Tax=Porphyromonas somerae TaxID=322095 RepID=UPI002A7647B5|nr:hypothetical protein [Porphyromonas somerae]MDY3120682.1 hypothetical protein [Porphyromonas somerae]